MLTGAPPSDRASLTPAPRRRVWPWAAGSILITLAVIAATLIGHRLAAQARLASQVAPAPAAPPLAVEAIAHASGQITRLTLDSHAHTLVAQVIGCRAAPPTTPQTPQATACDSADVVPVSGVAFFDAATGALRGEYLSPSSAPAQAIALTDTARGLTYLLNNGGVTVYADAAGKQTNRYDSQLVAMAQAAALDEQTGLMYTLDGKGNLGAFTAVDGQAVASATLPLISPLPPQATPQVFVDAAAGRVYVFASGHNEPEPLFAFNAANLTPLGSWRVAQDIQLGPLDPATHTLYLWEPGAIVSTLDLSALPAQSAGQSVNPQRDATLSDAIRFGFVQATGTTLRITSAGIQASAAGAAQPYAQIPLVRPLTTFYGDASPWLLPIDASAGLAYLPGDDNTILIVSLARPTSYATANAATAALIARAGMARLLPDTNQDPPFITAQTFPLSVGKVTRNYFIHYSDLGWKGPYAGTASIGGVTAGATPGDYTMTFTITWNQLFLRQHSWTVEVTPDGRTHLLADSGDAVP
jgi:hypothetical protein